jgi:hypothetical protein
VKRAGHLPTLLLAAVLSAGGSAADAGRQLLAEPSRLPALVAALPPHDLGARWELANVALEVMIDAYATALDASTSEVLRSAERRQKLYRWQRGTLALLDTLDRLHERLLIGSAFAVFTDGRGRLHVIIDGQPIVFSGLGDGDDRLLEQRVVERFCRLVDCSGLLPPPEARPAPRQAPSGHWEISQRRAPVYVVDGVLRCGFDDLQDRSAHGRYCQALADDLVRLDEALEQARGDDVTIDWPTLAASRRVVDGRLRLDVNTSGDWLTLTLPALSTLDGPLWRMLLDSLRPDRGPGEAPLISPATGAAGG